MTGRAVSRGVAVAFLALLGGCLPLLAAAAPTLLPSSLPRGPVRVGVEDGVAVNLSEEKGITVEASPRPGEGLAAFAQRFCGDAGLGSKVTEANGGSPDLKAGARYTIPFDLLSPEWQLKASRALFAEDRGRPMAGATRCGGWA